MKELTIKSLEEFMYLQFMFPEVDFFRGHSSSEYKLIPSIGRLFQEGKEDIMKQYEQAIFNDFKRKYSMFTDVRPKNDKEFLFLAQHYGLPTRLLDWTYNPLVALYFSCCSTDVRYKNQNGLFVLYPEPWKENFEHISNKYIIPAKHKKDILNKLYKIGITRSFIMPSLDSLCKDIAYMHNIRYPHHLR